MNASASRCQLRTAAAARYGRSVTIAANVSINELLLRLMAMIAPFGDAYEKNAVELTCNGIVLGGNVMQALLHVVRKDKAKALAWVAKARAVIQTFEDVCSAIEQHLETGQIVRVGNVMVGTIELREDSDGSN